MAKVADLGRRSDLAASRKIRDANRSSALVESGAAETLLQCPASDLLQAYYQSGTGI